jgi:hypothetical protein
MENKKIMFQTTNQHQFLAGVGNCPILGILDITL